MKITSLPILLLAALVPHVGTSAETNALPPGILTVAVFDFESKDEGDKNVGAQAATLVNANLSAEPYLNLVERAELDKALGEQELGLSGTVSPDTAAKVGQLTGAKVLVTGRLFKTGKEQLLVTKVIGTETSRVFGQVSKGPAKDASLSDMAAEAAKAIAADIAKHGSELVARVETREDRVAKIRKAVGSAKLPTVSVHINEQHFGGPVVDPAAETEMGLLLKEAGFALVDDKSTNKADVEITGDAFSAYALRKGNLVSCKARVELKVHGAADGKVLAVDRQTSVAVDIAEQTAAKTALQTAAGELAERIAPKLVQKP